MADTLSIGDLPPADPSLRWTIARKAQVVAAVRDGVISETAAQQRWSISAQEFAAWCRDIDRHGVAGLRATRMQMYRRKAGRQAEEKP